MQMKNEFVPVGGYVDLSDVSSNLAEMWFVQNTIVLDNMNDGGNRAMPLRVIGGMVLVVKFKYGIYYAYAGVPAPLWQFILDGKTAKTDGKPFSIGAAFDAEVVKKKDLYPYKRLSAEEVEALI